MPLRGEGVEARPVPHVKDGVRTGVIESGLPHGLRSGACFSSVLLGNTAPPRPRQAALCGELQRGREGKQPGCVPSRDPDAVHLRDIQDALRHDDRALQGNANVSKETLQSLTGGAGIPIPAGLSVPLGLSGSLAQPAVNVNAEQAVAGFVTGAARQKGEELKQNVQERARREARRGLGDALKRLGK